ncbi:MAG: 30S ribosomal protein S12 methylthiotransferase RimO [Bacteroidales bacterium]|nr:30S ribosomal protein S12 methylthiotransferase RimO [Bacteroidales bacterium]
MPSVRVISLGCSKNTVDTEVLSGNLKAEKWTVLPEESPRAADLTIINTCGFILDAKQESIDTVLRETARKNRRKKGHIIVMGCLVQRYAAELRKEIPDVDAWIGVNDLDAVMKQARQILQSEAARGSAVDPLRRKLTTPPHYAYLKVSEGCNRQCAFCAIPLIRGKHVSRPQEEIVEEARRLVDGGVKELILVAQDLCYYGMDLYGRRAVADLVRSLCRIEGLHWLRLQYLYPHAFPDDLLEVMRTESKVCPYIDIPLQHINTKVLKDMLRTTTKEETLALLKKFKQALPDAAFRTTLITGFPTEGEKEFKELKAFVGKFEFDRLGVFPYSQEEGTPAYSLGDPVPQEEKERRAQEIMDLQEEISYRKNLARVGNIYEVLIDREEGEFYVGRTVYDSPEVDNEVLIRRDSSPVLLPGHFYQVRITSVEAFDLYGKVEA